MKRTLAILILLICLLGLPGNQSWAAGTHFRLILMGTTDVHGRIYPTHYLAGKEEKPVGLARVSTLVKKIRREQPHTLLVDVGDLLQGTPLTYYYGRIASRDRHPVIAVMNAMGYDAAAIGNHEFDYGLAVLEKAIGEARFPFLSANAVRAGTDHPYWKPYVIQEHWGIKVGFIGFTPPGVAVWARPHVQGRQEFQDIVATARTLVPEMKRQGADIVVALAHSGLGEPFTPAYSGYFSDSGLPPENVCTELARQVPDIDVIFAGHTHADVPEEVVNGVLITQAGKWGERLSVAELDLNRTAQGWQVRAKRSYTLSTAAAPPDPEILSLAREAHENTLAYINAPVGTSTEAWSSEGVYFQDTPLMDLVNEVQRRATGAELSSASVLNPAASIPKGKVSLKDIASLYIYDNTLLAIRITGKQLKDYLEHSARFFNQYPAKDLINHQVPGFNYDIISGVDYEIDISQPVGHRIRNLTYRGKPVTDTMTFTMALNNFRQGGGGGYAMVKRAPVVYNKQEEIRDLLIDYVRRQGTISPKDVFLPNWRIVPAEAVQQLGGQQPGK